MQTFNCPECGRQWQWPDLVTQADTRGISLTAMRKLVSWEGCRAFGVNHSTGRQSPVARDIATILHGVDFADGFVPDESNAFGLFE